MWKEKLRELSIKTKNIETGNKWEANHPTENSRIFRRKVKWNRNFDIPCKVMLFWGNWKMLENPIWIFLKWNIPWELKKLSLTFLYMPFVLLVWCLHFYLEQWQWTWKHLITFKFLWAINLLILTNESLALWCKHGEVVSPELNSDSGSCNSHSDHWPCLQTSSDQSFYGVEIDKF